MSDLPRLACLGGRAASAELLADLHKLTTLSPAAQESLWAVLGPCLGERLPDDLEERVDRFCRDHGADAGELGDALSAARALLRGAASLDMTAQAFADDVAQVPGGPAVAPLLLAGYDAAKARLREEIVRDSLADHGKVLDGIAWRADTVTASHRGRKLDAPIAVLTLRYKKGDRDGRFTLQVTEEGLRELMAACKELLP
jgi:hypothetical protein